MRKVTVVAVVAGEASVPKGHPSVSTSRYSITDAAIRGWMHTVATTAPVVPVLANHEGEVVGKVTEWRYEGRRLLADLEVYDDDLPVAVGQPVSMTSDLTTRMADSGQKVATSLSPREVSIMSPARGGAFPSSKVLSVGAAVLPLPAPRQPVAAPAITVLASTPYEHTGRQPCERCGARGTHAHEGSP